MCVLRGGSGVANRVLEGNKTCCSHFVWSWVWGDVPEVPSGVLRLLPGSLLHRERGGWPGGLEKAC